jgi:hypothetical protein
MPALVRAATQGREEFLNYYCLSKRRKEQGAGLAPAAYWELATLDMSNEAFPSGLYHYYPCQLALNVII